MKRKLFSGFVWILLFLVSVSAFGDDQTIRILIGKAGDAETYPGSDQVVVFDSTRVRVMDTGLSYVTMHRITKVLTPNGAIQLSVQHFDYDPLSAFVEVKLVRIIRKDGKIELIPLKSVLDHAAPARAIYWGAREKMVPVGRLETGDALETIVFRKGFTYALLKSSEGSGSVSAVLPQTDSGDEKYIPPMRGHFYDIVEFWSRVPVKIKSYTVSLPSDKPLQFQVYNGEVTSWVKFHDDRTVYHWEKSDIPPFEREADGVAYSDVAPKLLMSTSPDWYAKSSWFYSVNEDYGSFDVTPGVKAKVDELILNCETDMEKVHVLTHWVAEEIRYSGLSMGPGEGFTLHKGEMTFRDRCGVCKDKAGMLVTMLRAAGFESFAAMTMAGSRIDRIPADQFNHSVTIWKRGEGDYVLLDPTWVPGVRELWSSAEQQQEYLMGLPEGADLKTTPVSPPENHYFRVRGKSALSADGSLEGSLVIEAEGQTDARIRRYLRGWLSSRQQYFSDALYEISPKAEMTSLSYQDPYDLSLPMKIEIGYRIPQYARILDNEMVFTPVVARHLFSNGYTHAYLRMNLSPEERKYPFRTRCSKLIDFQETVTIPSGYQFTNIPEFETESGNAADFQADYQTSGRKLTFIEKASLKKRIYPADEWPNFRKAVTSIQEVAEAPVVITKK